MTSLGTYLWVQTDLVEALYLNNGTLPPKWRPRKRLRSGATASGCEGDTWGWCRARVISTASPSKARNDDDDEENTRKMRSPFGAVKLRQVNSSSSCSPPKGSPVRNQTVSASIVIDDDEHAPPELQNVRVQITYNTGDSTTVCAANAWWIDPEGCPPDDLTALEQLHEPAVVYCLQRRYEQDDIYTYTGKILLALNPFRPLPHLYADHVLHQYSQVVDSRGDRPPPHIFAIAADAYRSMMISMTTPAAHPQNQSILVSGESGAGKTVTTKIIMRYLATLSSQQQSHDGDDQVSIEAKVLQSNPILESFGNARTIRNDNSSRFGKFIEIQFEKNGTLVSASIETYLLEKVRLVSHAVGERNYHVFYELLAGLPQKDRREMSVANVTARDFKMTAGTLDRRDGIDDRETYRELRHALDTVGFSKEEQRDLFKVACALLYTSNLTFVETAADASELDRSNSSLRSALAMLGVTVDNLNDALCRYAIEARGEILYKNLSVERAHKAVEALIKTTYGAMFSYIVKRINSFICRKSSTQTVSIGVLDIFGFESFETNSFEQLCINYCNEALQQQFNRFVFKLEQQEYEKEGIDWSFIEFPDNQDVLDLIEKRHEGILSILDEQSRLQRCTDKTFALAVYDKFADHHRLQATQAQRVELQFSIHHYAGWVEYDTTDFLEKNKDELPKESTELLKSSSLPFLALLGRNLIEPEEKENSQPKRKALQRTTSSILRDSVGSQFSSQLSLLRKRIEATAPHYVRCLKPNDELVPNAFDPLVISDQLRCAGVLEAIRVSRVGFPHRYFHDHFVARYQILAKKRYRRSAKARDMCEDLVDVLTPKLVDLLQKDAQDLFARDGRSNRTIFLGMQMGTTKVFLRRRAFEGLEHLRARLLEESIVTIQSFGRMIVARTKFEIAIYAATVIQNFVRRIGAYRLMQAKKIEDSADIIQKAWLGFVSRRLLQAARLVASWCQSMYRGAVARQYCAYLFLDQKSAIIQRAWGRYRASRFFRKVRRAVIFVQNRHRSRVAYRHLLHLRREARDLSSVAAERDRFREESLRLRKELEEAKRMSPVQVQQSKRASAVNEVHRLKDEVRRLQMELEKAHRLTTPSKRQDGEIEMLMGELSKKEEELGILRQELAVYLSRDESSSITGRSFALRSLPSLNPGCSSKSSPIRSDVSLLDAEIARHGYHDTPQLPPVGYRVVISPQFASPSSSRVPDQELMLLHTAVRQGNRELFDQVITAASEIVVLVNEGDKYGRTALHLASLSQNLEMAEVLIAKGAVVNAQDDDGETPLHMAETVSMTELLLLKGKANPNIPNVDGICALHLAVQRRDIDSVRVLLRNNADVNNADNVRWFTALHLIALPARNEVNESAMDDTRARIAQLLTGKYGNRSPDLDYQDSEGNSPLHYAVQLETEDAVQLVDILLEQGANPNIKNHRNQTPLHLLCHNEELRNVVAFQETLHSMLSHGADPNLQSLTGCTPLHLTLYHKDISSAVQLVSNGAELHMTWQKPKRWASFWEDRGSNEVLSLAMVIDDSSLYRILSAISGPQQLAPNLSWCMHCRSDLGSFTRARHCRHCSRLVCGQCTKSCLPVEYFPKNFEVKQPSWVCTICEKILSARKEEDMSSGTMPTSSCGDDDDDDHFSC